MSDATPSVDGLAIAQAVLGAVRHRGTYHLPPALLARLAELRDGGALGDPRLAAFLDSVLGRHDGLFRNRTYLALPLLERLLADPGSGLHPAGLAAVLMSDVVGFETAAARRGVPDDRPKGRVLASRLRHARRFVDRCLVDRCIVDSGPVDLPTAPGRVADWLPATVLPVSTRHDEYFFIRALQCHELTFTEIVADQAAAVRAIRTGEPGVAAAHIGHAVGLFTRAAVLFRVVATLRPDAFHAFRRFTEGASAIQSDQYKRFEALCGAPHPDRLQSEAYAGVPAVRAEVLAGQDDLSRAYLDTRPAGGTHHAALDAALHALEDSHQRWRTAHVGLATSTARGGSRLGLHRGRPLPAGGSRTSALLAARPGRDVFDVDVLAPAAHPTASTPRSPGAGG